MYRTGHPSNPRYVASAADRALLAADHAEMLVEAGVTDLLALPTALDRWTTDVAGFGGDHTALTHAVLVERAVRLDQRRRRG